MGEACPVVAIEVTPNVLSYVLAKRKRQDVAGSSGRKKSKAPMSLHAIRQATGLMATAGCLSIEQDVPLAASTIEALAPAAVEAATPAIPAPSPLPAVETMPSKVILMMPKNQELSKVSRIKIQEFKNQDSRIIKIKIQDSRFKNQKKY